jgi:hypothetical protein
VLQVSFHAVTALYSPPSALSQHVLQVFFLKAQGAGRTYAGRDGVEQGGCQELELRGDLLRIHICKHQADATGYIVTHSTWRDDPFVHGKGGDSPDGKAVSPMYVRHCITISLNAREARDIGHLSQYIFFL